MIYGKLSPKNGLNFWRQCLLYNIITNSHPQFGDNLLITSVGYAILRLIIFPSGRTVFLLPKNEFEHSVLCIYILQVYTL